MIDDDTPDPALAARAVAEAELHDHAARGDLAAVATGALRLYGDELLAFLCAMARDEDLAAEAFAEFAEDFWRGLPGFRWAGSLRAWCYTLARHALSHVRRDPRRRAVRNLPLSIAPELAVVVHTRTHRLLQTETKDQLRTLRESLEPEDHELLILRLDRQLSWKEIARILGGEDDVDARAATLRKRYERAKTRLRTLAVAAGLL
jgi:RNA polymerase sigma-70 factor (ECF subfamily)